MSQEEDNGFLSRWSRRKLTPTEEQDESQLSPEQEPSEEHDSAESEDKAVEQEAAEKPVWQRDDVDEDTKKEALRALFHRPEFNDRCRLNEYDDDFTQFASLGNIVTHEMKRALKKVEESTRPVDEPDSQQTAATDEKAEPEQDKEDKDLA